MTDAKDTCRDKLFCYYMAEMYNGREAAIKAGYPARTAETQAAMLLMKPKNRKRIDKFREENRCRQIGGAAVQGLLRLAFGPVGDTVKLMKEDDVPAAEDLDLFHVAEMRRPKGGGMEVKLLSRLDALRMLLELSGGEESGAAGPGSIYSALEQATKAAISGSEPDMDFKRTNPGPDQPDGADDLAGDMDAV